MTAKIQPEHRECPVCLTVFLVGGTGNKKRTQKYCSKTCQARTINRKPVRHAEILAEHDAPYIAGYVDADGHINMYRHGGKYFLLHLSVSSTNRDVLEWIREVTGVGAVHQQHRGTERRKPTYQWVVTSTNAYEVVTQIRPWLKVKQAQAAILVDVHERRQDPVLSAQLDWQDDAVTRMRELTRRGPRQGR